MKKDGIHKRILNLMSRIKSLNKLPLTNQQRNLSKFFITCNKFCKNSVLVRTITAIIMLLLFILFFSAGHLYASLLVFLVSVGIFRELIKIKRRQERDRKIPLFYLISWYFFAVCIFFLYPRYIEDKLMKYSIKY